VITLAKMNEEEAENERLILSKELFGGELIRSLKDVEVEHQ